MLDAESKLQPDAIQSQTDIILPSQYFAGSAGLSGEQRLMLAVLIDAINVLHNWRRGGSASRNFVEAAQWVNIRGTSRAFSFDSVCDALEIDSELLRSRLPLSVRSAHWVAHSTTARLRLKELSRRQHLSANRLRRQERASVEP